MDKSFQIGSLQANPGNPMIVKCGHCQGTGQCRRSSSGNYSCDSCCNEAGVSNTWNAKLVRCGVCGGVGQAHIRR